MKDNTRLQGYKIIPFDQLHNQNDIEIFNLTLPINPTETAQFVKLMYDGFNQQLYVTNEGCFGTFGRPYVNWDGQLYTENGLTDHIFFPHLAGQLFQFPSIASKLYMTATGIPNSDYQLIVNNAYLRINNLNITTESYQHGAWGVNLNMIYIGNVRNRNGFLSILYACDMFYPTADEQ